MRWPWQRLTSKEPFIVSWSAQTFAFVQATPDAGGLFHVKRMGVEQQGADSPEDFVKRLAAKGLRGAHVRVMLRPEQYQILQIPAPAVAPEELRSAARFQIRDMVDAHMDDLTLDVMRVGDEAVRANNQLFVVAAANAMVRTVLELGDALHWDMQVIDIQDMAQRNLQTAVAQRSAKLERAGALLFVTSDKQALLTISAKEELFYTRRIELSPGFMEARWGQGEVGEAQSDDPFADVPEYVPSYAAPAVPAAPAEDDVTQRFVVELQRSLDVWDRTWPNLPLDGLSVRAGQRSGEMAQWLSRELGLSVSALDVAPLFPGFDKGSEADQAVCYPLLGALLRSETRKL
jgi:MSHA biogenesis protein MshI